MSEKITKFTRFRSWLERNKVFFELSTAILLAYMSYTVSINANQIATYQNDLVKEQNNLIKDENQPIFQFNFTQFNNDNLDSAERIDIYNIGKPAHNFQAEAYVLCNIQLHNSSDNEYTKISFYQKNYYINTSMVSPVGLMNSFDSAGFLTSLPRYLNSTSLSCLQNQSNIEQVQLTRYVHFTYSDIYGENHDEVYCVTKLGSFKLTESEKIMLVHELDYISYVPR